jgi:hypothetical protein
MRTWMIAAAAIALGSCSERVGSLDLTVTAPEAPILVGTREAVTLSTGVVSVPTGFMASKRGTSMIPLDDISISVTPPIFEVTYEQANLVLTARHAGTAVIAVRGKLSGDTSTTQFTATAVPPAGVMHRIFTQGDYRDLRAGDRIALGAGVPYEMLTFLLNPDGSEMHTLAELAEPVTGEAITPVPGKLFGTSTLASATPRTVLLPGDIRVAFVAPASGRVAWSRRTDDWLEGKVSLVDAGGKPIASPSSLAGRFEVLTPETCAAWPENFLEPRTPRADEGITSGTLSYSEVLIARKTAAPCKVRVEIERSGQPAFAFVSIP